MAVLKGGRELLQKECEVFRSRGVFDASEEPISGGGQIDGLFVFFRVDVGPRLQDAIVILLEIFTNLIVEGQSSLFSLAAADQQRQEEH